MGRDKLLLELDGEPLLRRAARTALGAGLDPVVVLLGPDLAPAHREALAGLPVTVAVNPRPDRGLASSIRDGVAALLDGEPRPSALVLLLADMPLVDAERLRALVRRRRETGAPVVVSDYDGVEAPPVVFGAECFGELLALPDGDDAGARPVVRRHRDEAARVRCPAGALLDLDRPEDLERLLSQGGGRIVMP